MREHGVPQFTVDGAPAGRARSTCSASASPPSSATRTCSPRSTSPASRWTAADRTDDDPIVVAGGHAAFNPEPIAEFIDAAVARRRRAGRARDHRRSSAAWKAEGRPGGRDELLLRLARTGDVYVPAFYDVDYLPDGRIRRVAPEPSRRPVAGRQAHRHGPGRVALPEARRWCPLAETVHERASVEIFRGCTRGCRFCQAGMITRPVRERSITGIGEMVEQALAATGFEEVGLLSLSSADHSEIADIAKGLADRYEGTQRRAVAAVAPGSTRSTSTWPTSCPATAAAPG